MSIFWSESFWLPEGETWITFDGPSVFDFSHALCLAVVLSILRIFICEHLLVTLGLNHGLKFPKSVHIPKYPCLEEIYSRNRRPSYDELKVISKKTDIGLQKLVFWFKAKRISTKVPTIVKFSESGWRLFFSLTIFIYGCLTLYDEPFLYDSLEYFRGYPHHYLNSQIFWYYMIELGYYVSGMFWLFFEVKRKDFTIMMVHHLATIWLIVFSYLTNFFRIGTIVMLLHDFADPLLEAAKIAKYIERPRTCMALFRLFLFVWILTRLGFFPFVVIWSTIFSAPQIIGVYPVLALFVGFLLVLQVLHLFWTVFILRVLFTAITFKTEVDSRSDSELSEMEESEELDCEVLLVS